MLRSGQKSVEYMMGRFLKYLEVGELELNTGSDTSSTTKGCLQVLEHLQFIGCENDSSSFQDTLPSLMEIFARHVFSPDANIAVSNK